MFMGLLAHLVRMPVGVDIDLVILQEFSVDEKRLVGPITNIFQGTELGLTEGAHLYRKNGYYNIMKKYGDGGKKLWPTEFGWASSASPTKNYEYAADNTLEEQAAYTVRAYEMAKAWGWVGPMFLWNLNFAPVSGKSDEKAAFGVVRHDWSPRPAFNAIRDMPK